MELAYTVSGFLVVWFAIGFFSSRVLIVAFRQVVGSTLHFYAVLKTSGNSVKPEFIEKPFWRTRIFCLMIFSTNYLGSFTISCDFYVLDWSHGWRPNLKIY